MELTEITQLIGSLGFPIMCTIAMFMWFTKHYEEEQRHTREVLEDVKETILQMQKTVETFSKLADTYVSEIKGGKKNE